jgi:hypothetical protein
MRTTKEIVELVSRGLGDRALYELVGGDGVGTDAYPALRDAAPALVELLRSPEAEVRMAAAYALAFVLEPAAETLPALDAALATAVLPLERAAMLLAAGRLRATVARWRGSEEHAGFDGVTLSAEAAAATVPAVRAALVIAELWRLPRWGRRVQPEVAAALEGLDGIDVGPWGCGDLGVLAKDVRASVYVAGPATSVSYAPASDEDEPELAAHAEDFGDDEVDDPYMQQRPEREPPRIALAGLHEVAWDELEHAYGKASSVPHMLDALSSASEDDRGWAISGLSASINHQGSVYSASGPAVPFLVELAGRADVEDRQRILHLLAGLAVHDPQWFLYADLDEAASPAQPEVAAGGPVFVRLLADPDRDVRTGAAYVLSFIMPPPEASAAVKRALALETDRYARSSLLLALGYIARRTKSVAERTTLERYLDDECPLLAGSAAIALAQLDGAACAPRVRTILARTVIDAPPITGPWPWNEGDLAGFARTVRLAILPSEALLDEADAAQARGDAESARDYALRAFARTFGDATHGPLRAWVPRELGDQHRRTLRTLISLAAPANGIIPPMLPMDRDTAFGCGLPSSTVAAARRLLGEERGALDTEVTVDGAAWPAWFVLARVLDAQLPRTALATALAPLGPAERVALVQDALDGPYELRVARTPFDFGDPAAYERANDRASAFILVLADILGGTELVGLTFARALAEKQASLGQKRNAVEAVLAALVLAREAATRGAELPDELDGLLLPDQAPATTYHLALRDVFALLPAPRRTRLLSALRLYEYWAHKDPRGEVRRWKNGSRWKLIDLLAPATRAEEVIGALREWERHRAAGDDPHATPLAGTTSSTQQRQPSADEDFPRDQAIAVLAATGPAGRAVIARELARGGIGDHALRSELEALLR